jgi:hypothetical protein
MDALTTRVIAAVLIGSLFSFIDYYLKSHD